MLLKIEFIGISKFPDDSCQTDDGRGLMLQYTISTISLLSSKPQLDSLNSKREAFISIKFLDDCLDTVFHPQNLLYNEVNQFIENKHS